MPGGMIKFFLSLIILPAVSSNKVHSDLVLDRLHILHQGEHAIRDGVWQSPDHFLHTAGAMEVISHLHHRV